VRRGQRVLVILAGGALVASGCGQATRTTAGRKAASITLRRVAAAPNALKRFRNCTAISSDLRAEAMRYVGPYGLPFAGGFRRPGGPVVMEARAGAAKDTSAPAAEPKAGVDYSGTNVQEEGVDEPDTVKTDGKHIFLVAGQTLRAAALDGGGPRLVGKLALNGYAFELLLSGDRLLILSTGQGIAQPLMEKSAADSPLPAQGPETIVQVVDVSNPAAMRVVSSLHVDGEYVAARQVDGLARIVIQRGSPAIAFTPPKDGNKTTLDQAVSTNRAVIARAGIGQWIPRYRLESGGHITSGALSSCSETYRPSIFSGFGTITVVTIDPRNPVPRSGSTVVGGGGTVYASQRSLYVTSQRMPVPMPLPINRPVDIVPVPDQTNIHKFDISAPSAVYTASGVVTGTLLNQFSMSEFEGNLRVATTNGPVSEVPSQAVSQSSVTVLAPRGSALTPIGHVAGLGVGQRIYAVRFIGPVGYVVTFKQIDPLYTIDLSNPRLPRVVGQLHVPGFSSYLHPIGNGLLVGIGEQVDAHARPIATKASLFDVSDLAHPKELQSLRLGGPNFMAEFDHHAFLWWGPTSLAVVPLQDYTPDGTNSFTGAIALHINRTMETLRTFSHPADQQQVFPITRSLVASNLLFTVSDAGLMANDLGSLSQRAWLPFK
jgi:uncharacterized secreted protein with C-terminal beta-propeller domain